MSQFKRALTRRAMGIARALFPVLHVGGKVYVFRDADVREIILRDQDFTIKEVNAKPIGRHVGPFFLGMDDDALRREERGAMHAIIKREDEARIRQFSRATAKSLLNDLRGCGEFDLISHYTRIIPLKFIGDYFGTPGPDPTSMLHWNRIIFWDIFLNMKDDATIRKNATIASTAQKAYLAGRIAEVKSAIQAGEAVPDTLLSRLLYQQIEAQGPCLNDEGIARNLAGTYMGALEPIAKAVVNILNQFYARPEVMAAARAAAAKDDVATVSKLAFEAYRFHPNLPLLMRYNKKDQMIGGDGRKQRRIKGDKVIWAFIGSAMFDKRNWPEPEQFNPERDPKKYLYFGAGLHYCYGAFVNYVMIPEMLMALLQEKSLVPVGGKSGKIEFDGTFPNKWMFRI